MNRARRFAGALALAAAVLAGPAAAWAAPAKLGGSPASMARQHEVAVAQDYSFLRTPAQVREYAEKGRLEPVTPDSSLALADVSFPYARTEVRVLVERLAAQYRAAVGEKLVVTSLTRPMALQPGNAHRLSVHPAGMAVDFRVPAGERARAWLQSTLLELERAGVLDVTREKSPPHYHVAVYPAAYRAYVERIAGPRALERRPAAANVPAPAQAPAPPAMAPATSNADGPGSPAALLLVAAVGGIAITGVRRRPRRGAAGVAVAD